MNTLFDKYGWQARILPAFIVLLPLALAGLAWQPQLQEITKPVLTLIVSAGVLLLLSQISRDFGKRAETKLLAEWGGYPSTALLRHRDNTLDHITKKRYHERLAKLIPGLVMPSASEESDDPEHADNVYFSCCKFLLSQTRDEKSFPLLLTENIYYGFRRNLFGLKPLGVSVSFIGLLISSWKLYDDFRSHRQISPLAVSCELLCLGLLILWLVFVNKHLVRQGAEAYAIRLLESTDRLEIK